jgi:DNA (cytosine-5)-methyltransferase 1
MLEQSTFWPEEHLASLSPSPVSERDWMTRVATSPSSLLNLLAGSGPYGWCGRTSPASCRLTEDGRLEPSSGCWSNSGICTAHTKSNGSGFSDDVAHTLESGSAQAVAFAQNTRDEVRLYGGDGKTVGALSARPGAKQQSYIAFSAKDYGADAGDVAPTLRGMGHDGSHPNGGGQIAIAFAQNQEGDVLSSEVMQSLGTNSNATGRNAPTIAYTLHGSDGTVSAASSTEVAGSLRTRAPGSIENSSTTAVLQEQPVGFPIAASCGKQADSSNTGSVSPNPPRTQMAVRRLTPRECERLQGLPDNYTLIEYRGKPAADGPRYKALGNSMARPVMHWLGQRIAAVDAILRDRPGVGRNA